MPMLTNLGPRFYVDPGLYEAERQTIFRCHWQMLGPAARVGQPGDYFAVDVAGWKLFALRGRDGVLRGFHNVSRHRGARLLAEGTGKCHALRGHPIAAHGEAELFNGNIRLERKFPDLFGQIAQLIDQHARSAEPAPRTIGRLLPIQDTRRARAAGSSVIPRHVYPRLTLGDQCGLEKKEPVGDRDAEGKEDLRQPCDDRNFVHDVRAPLTELIERLHSALRSPCATNAISDDLLRKT